MNAAVISTSLPQTIANEVFTAILDYPGVKLSLQTEKDIVEACEANTIAIPYYADVGSDNDDVIITVSIPDELTINTISNTWNNIVVQSGYTSNPVLLSGGDYTLIQTGGMNVYTIDIVQLLGDSLGALAGGTINVGVDTPCDATSNTVYTPTAQVYFANDYGQ
ncbi:MAG: hypothetical protein H6766_05380 [Candidatus Peribacteria bacterium]|nr:MAG: hypothetical protein H6766_05380 [Candidatus Peribacteria bacterium]